MKEGCFRKMKAIILAGGYGRRMWPITLNTAKPLLLICGRHVIDYVMEKLAEIDCLEKVIVLTNLKFEEDFRRWAKNYSNALVEIKVEESRSEEEKLGAVKALARISPEIDSDMIVVAGDNLFTDSLKPMFEKYSGKPIIALYDVNDAETARMYGVVQLDDKNRIIDFVEKPEKPHTTLVSTGVYIFPKQVFGMIEEYLSRGGGGDRLGDFIQWLYRRVTVYGHILGGEWWDIGSFESYYKAIESLCKRRSQQRSG